MPDEKTPPPPPWNDPDAAVPEPISANDPSTRPMAIPVLDERTFVAECCARLNAFLLLAPLEAQHILRTVLPYRHELVDLHRRLIVALGHDPDVDDDPGASVAALFAGILQTRHGDGYCIRPVFGRDPTDPTRHVLLSFEVAGQDVVHDEKT